MAICSICKKKIKFLDQYSEERIKGSFCKDCFKDKNKLKIYKEKQEKKEKEEQEQEQERLEEKLEDKKIKQEVKKSTPLGVCIFFFWLYFALSFKTLVGIELIYRWCINEININLLGMIISFFFYIYVIYLLYLMHKRKKRFINWFLVYLLLISFSYIGTGQIYMRFGFAILVIIFLKFYKRINYAFYN